MDQLPQDLSETQKISEESNKVLKKNFRINNMTVIDYRRELLSCKGTMKLKAKKKKTEAARKKRAMQRAKKRLQLIKEGKLKARGNNIGIKQPRAGNYRGDIIEKKPEVCHNYSKGFCHRGPGCKYMHEEFPCKFYHLSHTCFAGDQCKFSHSPLNRKSRQILMNYLYQCENKESNKKLKRLETSQQQLMDESSQILKRDSYCNENENHRLNFYVDTLNPEATSVGRNIQNVQELNFGSLFLNERTDNLCSNTKSKEIFSPPSPVLVKRGRILSFRKGNQSAFKQKIMEKGISVCSSSNSGTSVKCIEKNKLYKFSCPIRFKLGFSLSMESQIRKVEQAKRHKQFYSKICDIMSMMHQLLAKETSSSCLRKQKFKILWAKRHYNSTPS